MVTAQRRPERAEDVPISLTVRSGEALERMQATEMSALGKVVPSLVMMRTGSFTQPYLRGVGKRSTLGVENSVATYVDGVYLASSISALLDLRGIERIEVLNGPQGTLFGRNATGGVIQIVTRDPIGEDSGEVTLHAGTDGYLRSDLYLTGGDEQLAGNLAMSLSRNGGYGLNFYTGRTSQGETDHSLAARSKWVWRPDGPLTLTLAGDYQDIDQDFASLPVEGYTPIGLPRIQTFRDHDQDSPARYSFQYGGLSLRAVIEIGKLSLMSLTAVRALAAAYGVDLDLGPTPLFSASVAAKQDQFSQEIQLRSSGDAKLQWVTGLYFLSVEEQYDPTTFGYTGAYSARLGGRTGQALFSRGTASAYAAYAQGTLPLRETTRLTLGLRYTIEERALRANGQQGYAGPPAVRPIPGLPLPGQDPFRNRETFSELTWRGSLDHHFSDEAMAYLAVSRGFQSGGWNLQTPQIAAFGPETLDDFEAGLKIADQSQQVSADVNVFYYDYEDVQVSAITPMGNGTINAASADAYGMELQLNVRADEQTELTLGLARIETRFGRFPNASCINYTASAPVPYAPMACDVSGNHLPFAPELKLNVGASHRTSLGKAGTLLLSGNAAYNSGYFAEPDNVVRQGAYATVDVSAEWRPLGHLPSVRLWVINLTDAQYSESLVAFPTAGVLRSPAAPTQAGVSLSYGW
ncbi:MAG TPA: TonB-dependent receptor [Croceibacterium sp.]